MHSSTTREPSISPLEHALLRPSLVAHEEPDEAVFEERVVVDPGVSEHCARGRAARASVSTTPQGSKSKRDGLKSCVAARRQRWERGWDEELIVSSCGGRASQRACARPPRVGAPRGRDGRKRERERKRTVLARTAHHLAVAARVKLEERADVVHLAAVRLPAVVARVVPLEL